MRKTATVVTLSIILLAATLLVRQGRSQDSEQDSVYLPLLFCDDSESEPPTTPEPTPSSTPGASPTPLPATPTPTLPPPGDGDWTMVAGNPQRSSWTPEEVTGQLELAWYRPIEAYIPQNSQVIAANGLLYIATSKGLYALHAATGAIAWRFDTALPLGNSPTVADGVVYVGGYDRKLHALDAVTGRHLWAFSGAEAGFDTNPLVVEGLVFAGNRDGKMYAIGAHGSPNQGQMVWFYQAGGPIHLSAAYSNGVIYFAANDMRAYALNAGSGRLVWRSGILPGIQFQSYWPVIYQDMVIFAGSAGYRDGLVPGTNSLSSAAGPPFSTYRALQLESIFPELVENTPLGEEVPPQPWSHGYPIIDASRLTQLLENNPTFDPYKHKPYRRVLIALHLSDGTEFTYDSDGDGYREFLPAGYWGTGSGNVYPPLVGPDNLIYFNNVYLCCSDAKGRITGWQPSTPGLLSVTGGLGALAESQAISAGGNVIYRNLCCDRLADWFNLLDPQERSGQLWSYNLDEIAPGYDEQTWIALPGWPRLQGWYQGNSNSSNAAYHNHGAQNPVVPYRGRAYTHRSNVIFAFGPPGGPGEQPLLTAASSGAPGDSLSEAELVARLEHEIQAIVDAGHLRPGYYNVGQFSLYSELADYFDNPGDTLYTLAAAYPHLSESLQSLVRTYLQQEFDTYFDPEMFASTGWADGAAREEMSLPPEIEADMADRGPRVNAGPRFSWQYPPHNFYAMWKYAEIIPGDAARAYQLAKGKLEVPVPNLPIADYFDQKPFELNAWIAGYIGFLELQELAGMSSTDAGLRTSVQNELDRLLQLRVSTFSKDSYWGFDNFHYKKRLDVARNFIYMVPELADYLQQQIPSELRAAINEYQYVAPYWFVSRYESAIGESVMQHLYDYNALFLARAYILDEAQAELSKYVDVPAFARGDLFYIQNLVAAIEAP